MADEKGRTNQQWLSMSVNNLLRNSICYFVMTFSFLIQTVFYSVPKFEIIMKIIVSLFPI